MYETWLTLTGPTKIAVFELVNNERQAEIREIFGGRRGTQIAGCRVTDGRMVRNGAVRVTREGENITQTTITSLRHFREEVNEMNAGTECGIVLQGFNEFQTGDILEVFRQERARR